MSNAFGGAQPKVLRQKNKYNTDKENTQSLSNIEEQTNSTNMQDTRTALNIMHDKRVFRGNTHGMNILKGGDNLTPA
jgi:hypothetical protein